MGRRKEHIYTLLLILLGVIVVPVLFIWSADNLFVLTIKTFLAAFFLLVIIRLVFRKRSELPHRDSEETPEDSWVAASPQSFIEISSQRCYSATVQRTITLNSGP